MPYELGLFDWICIYFASEVPSIVFVLVRVCTSLCCLHAVSVAYLLL